MCKAVVGSRELSGDRGAASVTLKATVTLGEFAACKDCLV